MAKYDFPTLNNTGVDEVLIQTAESVSIFTPMLLAFIFLIVMVTGYRKQRLNTGVGDAPLWGTIAGVVTTLTALILSLGVGMVDLSTLVIVIVITIVMAIWLFASKDKI